MAKSGSWSAQRLLAMELDDFNAAEFDMIVMADDSSFVDPALLYSDFSVQEGAVKIEGQNDFPSEPFPSEARASGGKAAPRGAGGSLKRQKRSLACPVCAM